MLAPFFIILLMWCVVMLFAGWAFDFISGWRTSARHGATHSKRSASGRASQFKPHVPVCAGCDMQGGPLVTRGVTKHRTNA